MKTLYYNLLLLLGIPRPLKKLYCLLYDNIKDKSTIDSLCAEICCLFHDDKLITKKEFQILSKNFMFNKPSVDKHFEFTQSSTFSGNGWWWDDSEDDDPINRKAFVKHLINNHIK